MKGFPMADPAKAVETKVDQTTVQPAATDETKETGVETNKADDTAKPDAPKAESTPQVDYEAELDRLTKQLEKAERTIVDTKRELKSKKDVPVVTPEPADDGEYVTAEELTRNIEKKVESKVRIEMEAREAKIRQELASDTIAEEIGLLSDNPDEQKLISFHYEHTIRQSGFSRGQIREDLRRARLIANEKVPLAENQELKEALKAKHSVSKASVATNQDREETWEPPKLSSADQAVVERAAVRQGISVRKYLYQNRSKFPN